MARDEITVVLDAHLALESGRGQVSASITLDDYTAEVVFNDNFETDYSERNKTLDLIK